MMRVHSMAWLLFTVVFAAPSLHAESVDRTRRANVMIEAASGSDRQTVASGVILLMRGGVARIATARHVVDRDFIRARDGESPALDSFHGLTVSAFDQVQGAATVEWLAPHGIDLAILTAPLRSTQAEPAHWDRNVTPRVDADVFTIGNPGGAGWVQAAGTLAQIRDQQRDGYAFQMLRTNLRLEPGNSGGGLYDAAGRLIGINSMATIGDPRFPGGVGLSTALSALLDLAPPQLGLPASNLND